uniref:Uncharacterized protein n=1 Tax=Meloidogyne enterolobii TaxID=390850 RepID=A0A6V7WUX5_MELEN|nr:unnamed protein product [Meloidogyne enterolobii]
MVTILSKEFSIDIQKDDYSDFNHNSNLDRVVNACTQNVSIRPSMNEIAEFLNGDIDQFEYERNADIDHHQHHNIEYFHQYDPHQYEIPQAEHAHPEHHGRSSNVHGEIKRSPRH